MKFLLSNKWMLASLLMSFALCGMNSDQLSPEEFERIQERLAQMAQPTKVVVESEEFTLEFKTAEAAARAGHEAAQPSPTDSPSVESVESSPDVSNITHYDAVAHSPVPVRPLSVHRKAASLSAEVGVSVNESLEKRIADSKPATAPVSPLSSPCSKGSASSVPSPRPPTPSYQNPFTVNPAATFNEIKSELDKLNFAELFEYAKSFPHSEHMKEYLKNRHIAEMARVEKELFTPNPAATPERISSPLPKPHNSPEMESINRNSAVPTLDFKASEMSLAELKEIDPISLTPRTRESLAARIEFLQERAKGPVSGDPKGEIVDDGYMQRVWTTPEAAAERARRAVTCSADTPPGRPVPQVIPGSPEESHRVAVPQTPEQQWHQNDLPTNKDNPPSEGSRLTTVLEIAGIALVAWTTAEVIFAYKNISQKDWNNAKRLHNKIDLLARKTGNAMISRPGQVATYAGDLINKMMPDRAKKSS